MGQVKVEIELENPTDRELYRLRYIKKSDPLDQSPCPG